MKLSDQQKKQNILSTTYKNIIRLKNSKELVHISDYLSISHKNEYKKLPDDLIPMVFEKKNVTEIVNNIFVEPKSDEAKLWTNEMFNYKNDFVDT